MIIGQLIRDRLGVAGNQQANVFFKGSKQFMEIAFTLNLLVFFVELHLNF